MIETKIEAYKARDAATAISVLGLTVEWIARGVWCAKDGDPWFAPNEIRPRVRGRNPWLWEARDFGSEKWLPVRPLEGSLNPGSVIARLKVS